VVKRCLAMASTVLVLAPSVALAQQSKAGVVTTLEGNVSARRVALPNPVPLKFKDDVFLQDTVTTGDKALARMLLGGKAVVTVRERSILTITEVPGRSTLELDSGKFALAVAREKMRPGEEIHIRTPNAIAGVRGTVVITEVSRQGAQTGGAAPAAVTNFYVLRGSITAQPLDPTTRQPLGTPMQVGALQAYAGAGTATPSVKPVPAEQVGQITAGLQPSGPKGGSEAGQEQVKAQAVQTATTLLTALTGGQGGPQTAFAVGPTPPPPAAPPAPGASAPPIVAFEADQTQLDEIKALVDEAKAAISDLLDLLGNVTFNDKAAKSFTEAFSSTSTSPLVQLTNAIVVQTGGVSFVQVLSGGDVSLAGPLIVLKNSSLVIAGKLLEIEGGRLKSTTSSALISLDPSSVTASDAIIAMNGGTLTLAGPLLTDTDGTLTSGGALVRMQNSATLTSTSTDALVQLSGTTVNLPGALAMRSSSMTLAGPLARVSNVTQGGADDGTDDISLFKLDASTITSTGTGALISFSSSDADPDGNFLRLVNGSKINLSGPLFSATGGRLSSGEPDSVRAFFSVLDSSTITGTTTSTLISMSDVTFDADGPLFNVRRSTSTSSPSRVTLAGPLFSAENTTINTTTRGFGSTFGTTGNCCSTFGVEQGAILSSSTSSALINLSGSTVTISDSSSGGSFFLITDTVSGFSSSELVAPSAVALAGPLLAASSTTITPLFSLLQINRSSLTSTTTSDLIRFSSSTVTAGGTDIFGTTTFGRMLTLISAGSPFGTAASPASVSLAGTFLSAIDSTLRATQVIGIFGGASFTSTTTNPLVSLENTSLRLTTATQGSITDHGDLVAVSGLGSSNGQTFATMALRGPLLNVRNGSTLDMTGSLALVFEGGQIREEHPTSPFVSISGGTTHKIASDAGNALFRLFGRAAATASETIDTTPLASSSSVLTLGSDEPLKRSGSGAFLETVNASIEAKAVLVMDDALLSASAPLLNMKNSGLTTAADAINLTGLAKLTAVGPFVKMDGSTLTVSNGHAIRVMGGSFLNVSGDLFSILNGGRLNLTNGAPLFVSGGSVVKISGGFVNFNNSSGQINVTNGVCSGTCATVGGLNFFLQNGASSSNLSVSNAIKNQGSGTLNQGLNNAVIILDGGASKVIISGN
jgi:hypothetical protein